MVSRESLHDEGHGSSSHRRIDETDAPPPTEPSVLDDVLQETLALGSDAITPEQMAALRDVAMRLEGQEFGVSPVGVALVEAILQVRYEAYSKTDPTWQAMAYQVAETLFETDPLRERVKGFWELLCESVK